MAMVSTTDLETTLDSEDLTTAPSGFGSVTSTTHQGTWEESHPPSGNSIQTSVPAVDPEVAHELGLAPQLLSDSPGRTLS